MRRGALLLLAVAVFACRESLDLDYGTTPIPSPTPSATPSATPTPLPTPFGTGQDGDVSIVLPNVMSPCDKLLLGTGSTLTFSGTGESFDADDRVLVMQVNDDFATMGSAADLTSLGAAGEWEVARIAATFGGGGAAPLTASLSRRYDSTGSRRAQVCLMREYRNATISATGSILGDSWNGDTGGVIAFFVSSTLDLAGVISADGIGFPGGRTSTVGGGASNFNDVTTEDQGGGKGWSLDGRARDTFGRGNLGNGGGGGNNHNAGGGGGGNGGAGGFGGQRGESDVAEPNTRGKPGSRVSIAAHVALGFGGGGGGGHQDGEVFGVGGAGGGLVLIFARTITGDGTIGASGADGGGSTTSDTADGAGGGGAGGTIVLLSADASGFDGDVRATGGRGGACGDDTASASATCGPGGGGGGGRVTISPSSGAAVSTSPGASGTIFIADVDTGNRWGATGGSEGRTDEVTSP